MSAAAADVHSSAAASIHEGHWACGLQKKAIKCKALVFQPQPAALLLRYPLGSTNTHAAAFPAVCLLFACCYHGESLHCSPAACCASKLRCRTATSNSHTDVGPPPWWPPPNCICVLLLLLMLFFPAWTRGRGLPPASNQAQVCWKGVLWWLKRAGFSWLCGAPTVPQPTTPLFHQTVAGVPSCHS